MARKAARNPGEADLLAQLQALAKRYSWIWRSGWPFALHARASPTEHLRAFGLREELAWRVPVKRIGLRVAMTLVWPGASLASALAAGWADRRAGSGGWLRRFVAYYRAALRHNAWPADLQRLQAQAGHAPDVAPQMLYNRDYRIWRALNRLRGADLDDVQDKARFAVICAAHGLPAVPVLAAFAAGQPLIPNGQEAVQGQSLFVKDLRGNLGAGAAVWHWTEQGYANDSALPATHATPRALLIALAGHDCVVQPLLRDAAALRDAGSAGLSTVRIVTLLSAHGETQVVSAILSLAQGMLSQYGEFFGIDCSTGALTTWFDQAAKRVYPRRERPAAFLLDAVPQWLAMVALAKRAHRDGFARFATLGWDVVLSDAGVLLLEANHGWGIMLHQVLGRPLGEGPIGAAAAGWLAEAGARGQA